MNALLDNTADLVLKLLNKEGQHIVNGRSLHSPRAVGDAVQEFLGERNGLQQCIPSDMLQSFESEFERRSMEDMAFYRCAWMGQIQIANANVLKFEKNVNRKAWMLQLCDFLDAFYDEEISKIGERKQWFTEIKEYWKQK